MTLRNQITPEPQRMRLLQLITPMLLIFGVQLWLILFHGFYGLHAQYTGLAIILAASLIPQLNRRVAATLGWLRSVGPRTVLVMAGVISILSTLYFPETGWLQGRNFQPKWHDELSYRIAFQQLLHGRLWYPQLPCPDFFDTFHVLVRPVYASIYFPGPSLVYCPALLAHLPLWAMSSLLAGLAVGVAFLCVAELIDPVAGLICVFLMLGNEMYRKLALMVFGYPLISLLTIGSLYAWLRWRKRPSVGWAVLIGVTLGWSAITRPLDAVIVAVPIGIDFIRDLRSRTRVASVKSAAAVAASAAPFLLLQIVFNLGVTGKATLSPLEFYCQQDYPDTTFGFHTFDASHRPVSVIVQKQKFYDEWAVPAIRAHTPSQAVRGWFPDDLRQMIDDLLPNRFMVVLLPIGLAGLFGRARVLFFLVLPLYMVFYTFYTFRLPHYAMIAEPALALIVVLGIERTAATWRSSAAFFSTFFTTAVVFLSLTEMAELNRYVRDEAFDSPGLATTNAVLAKIEHRPAVVLFHFPDNGNPHEEPVYNTDVAWPDDAPVVRAHDLGPRNIELFRYYAQHQPNRAFYIYDRADDSLHFLGYAPELAIGH